MVTAMSLRVVLIVAVLGAAALSACGGTDSASPTASPTLTRITTTEPDDSSSRSPSSTRTTTPSETTETTESEAINELVAFVSPSGNVGCIIDPQFARCDISERDWSPPPRPADCEFDYGQGISMEAGLEPEFNCVGDTALGGTDTLKYGKSIEAGSLSCDSTEEGITCRDSTTGHGFTIAREAYRIF
jgi:hypothetical protein